MTNSATNASHRRSYSLETAAIVQTAPSTQTESAKSATTAAICAITPTSVINARRDLGAYTIQGCAKNVLKAPRYTVTNASSVPLTVQSAMSLILAKSVKLYSNYQRIKNVFRAVKEASSMKQTSNASSVQIIVQLAALPTHVSNARTIWASIVKVAKSAPPINILSVLSASTVPITATSVQTGINASIAWLPTHLTAKGGAYVKEKVNILTWSQKNAFLAMKVASHAKIVILVTLANKG